MIGCCKLKKKNNTPFLHIDTTACKVDTFTNREVDISIYFRNTTGNVINIIYVDDLKVDATFLSGSNCTIPFCKTWTKHYSVLPNQSRQMNFYITSKKGEFPVLDFTDCLYDNGYLQLHCELSITLGYANSNDIFNQSYEFIINMGYSKENKNSFIVFDGIENSIEKEIS